VHLAECRADYPGLRSSQHCFQLRSLAFSTTFSAFEM
jgi:hypothetical protein